MKRFRRRFRRLQWRLTLSYTLTTVLAVLAIEIIVTLIIFLIVNLNIPPLVAFSIQAEAQLASPYFVHNGQADPAELRAWLKASNYPGYYQPVFLAIVDRQGRVLAAINDNQLQAGVPLSRWLTRAGQEQLRQSLANQQSPNGKSIESSNGAIEAIGIILDPDHPTTIQGALVMKTQPFITAQQDLFWGSIYLWSIGGSMLLFTIVAGLAGAIFGRLTARNFIQRFNNLAAAAEQWSQGNFAASVSDRSEDELGQLASQLNRMAEQLQNLLQTRQKLATLEERNRLARDLHDSVKQQIFAVVMRVGTARTWLDRDREQARTHLNEAERLVRQAQQELTALIRELHSVALNDKEYTEALKEYIADWSQQTGIEVELRIEGQRTLPRRLEDGLFRITQEALANIAHHSQASKAEVIFWVDQEAVELTIRDQGQGFAVEAVNARNQGIGLLSMRERVAALGGQIKIESSPNTGTSIYVRCEHQPAIKSSQTTE